jgi:A/G-specific adenine glycosylase
MAELPDFAALAAASEARVLKLWEGLGYYSRARRLLELGRIVAPREKLPGTAEAWLELPGVGPYTAAAIASISFGERVACVDGNVVRILARLTADGTRYRDAGTASRAYADLAGRLVPAESPGDHNQAMMELGATVCLRSKPLCGKCPVRAFCAAARRGRPSRWPRFDKKTIERRAVARVWCERRGSLLLHRAAQGARMLAGLHELPTALQAGLDPKAVARAPLVAKFQRSITRFRIAEAIHSIPAPPSRLRRGLAWVPLSELESITLSGPHRRWIAGIVRGHAK